MMRITGSLLLATLLCGCATNMAPSPAPAPAMDEGSDMVANLTDWPTNIVLDFFDIFDANVGMGKNDYPFGMHMQLTKLIRVGAFDMADLEILGLRNLINDGGEDMMNFDQAAGDYKVGMKMGFGAGAGLAMDLYEIYDWVVGVVTFNQYDPSSDH